MVTLIAAIAKDNQGRFVIGKDGDIPWKSKLDMKHFKDLTAGIEGQPGHPVIMGRKTWDSLPDNYKPLPGRMNYVLTRNKDYSVAQPGAFTASSIDEAMQHIANKTPFMDNIDYNTVFIIGGSSLYQEGLKIADKMELTFMKKTYEGDTFFPDYNLDQWKLIKESEHKTLWFKSYHRK
jgi:dihydrofolate reductase